MVGVVNGIGATGEHLWWVGERRWLFRVVYMVPGVNVFGTVPIDAILGRRYPHERTAHMISPPSGLLNHGF